MTDQPETADDQPMTGTEYFQRCLGRSQHDLVAGLGKYQAAHPTTINRVYTEALTRFPEAADVIAALVFWNAIDRNRDDFLRSVKNDE